MNEMKASNNEKIIKNSSVHKHNGQSEPLHSLVGEMLEFCGIVQKAMVPQCLPKAEGLEITTLFIPSKNIGGDLFDIVQVSDDLITFYIYDVSGQGVQAILLSSLVKMLFSHAIHRTASSPRFILEKVNWELKKRIPENVFITAFVAHLDLHNNKLTYSNAGYPHPLIYKKKDNKLLSLKTSNMFLGVCHNIEFENKEIYISDEDWIFIFSNGLYSLFSMTNELVGRKRLEDSLMGGEFTSPSVLLKTLKERYENKFDKEKQKDDIIGITVEILAQSRRDQIKKDLGFTIDHTVYLQFLSYYEEMDEVAAKILKEMDDKGYSDDAIRKMKLTITELLANAIGHGNNDDHTRKVTIGHVVDVEAVVVGIMDEGEGFNPDDVPDPTLPENLTKDHGRGLYIVKNYTDEMTFNTKGNRVRIKKYRLDEKKK